MPEPRQGRRKWLAYSRFNAISIIKRNVIFTAENKMAAGWRPPPSGKICAGGHFPSLCANGLPRGPLAFKGYPAHRKGLYPAVVAYSWSKQKY